MVSIISPAVYLWRKRTILVWFDEYTWIDCINVSISIRESFDTVSAVSSQKVTNPNGYKNELFRSIKIGKWSQISEKFCFSKIKKIKHFSS